MRVVAIAALAALASCAEGYPQDWCSVISEIGLCGLDGKCEAETEDGHIIDIRDPIVGAPICGTDWVD